MTESSPVLILHEVSDLLDSHTGDTFRFSPHVGENDYSDMELLRSGGGVKRGSIAFDNVSAEAVRFTVRADFTDGIHPETVTLSPGESRTFTRSEVRKRITSDGFSPFTFRRSLTVRWEKSAIM